MLIIIESYEMNNNPYGNRIILCNWNRSFEKEVLDDKSAVV